MLGLDVIMRLGLNIGARGESAMLTFDASAEHVAASNQFGTIVDHLEEVDFKAPFSEGKWTVAWKWLSGPPSLSPVAPEYAIKPSAQAGFDEEVAAWIENRILVPW